MKEIITETIIGVATPMASLGIITAAASFVSQEALWRHEDFWFAFRAFVCVSLFIGYTKGFFTYLEVTAGKTKP
tara:strand:+ start:248 stop:469 length:222 start_codon:yes stop_codon:yes gene_type:complete